MKKEKIEDIFSSMDNFSSVPPPELWNKIEEKLHNPKKKKAAVIWWSIAASLLIGTFISSVLHFNSGLENNIPVKTNNNVVLEQMDGLDNERTISTEKAKIESNTEPTPEKTEQLNNLVKNKKQLIETADSNADNKTQNKVNSSKSKFEKINSHNTAAGQYSHFNKQNAVASTTTNNPFGNVKRNTNQTHPLKNNIFEKNKFNSVSAYVFPNAVSDSIVKSEQSNTIAYSLGNQNSNKSSSIKSLDNTTTVKSSTEQKSSLGFTELLSKNDSIQLAELKNLEKGIVSEKKKSDKENPELIQNDDKWAISVFAGVANSENYSNEKTLGYVNNSKQTNTFGVKTKYKLNNKWAVGSGVKINELGQSVANVSYMSLNNSAFFTTGDYYLAQNSPVAKISRADEYILVSNNTKEVIKSENFQSGNLDQSLRYIEVPVEISYSIFNRKKASINLNTGGFVGKLISNTAYLDGNTIGENINANDYVYGSTFSSTLQYLVYKRTNVFVEPAMNYYINPLQSQSFNNFQWGFNFGLNVSF